MRIDRSHRSNSLPRTDVYRNNSLSTLIHEKSLSNHGKHGEIVIKLEKLESFKLFLEFHLRMFFRKIFLYENKKNIYNM